MAQPSSSSSPSPVPSGHRSVTPHLVISGAAEAISFYASAFGATEHYRMPHDDGRLLHGEIQIGDSRLFVADEFPEFGGAKSPKSLGDSPVTLHLYVENVDEAFQRAVDAGATAKMPPADMFWGDRYAQVIDPFGHIWSLATHIEDVSPEEMQARGKAAMSEGCGDSR